jgi:hypothetical protein
VHFLGPKSLRSLQRLRASPQIINPPAYAGLKPGRELPLHLLFSNAAARRREFHGTIHFCNSGASRKAFACLNGEFGVEMWMYIPAIRHKTCAFKNDVRTSIVLQLPFAMRISSPIKSPEPEQ